MNTLLRKRRQSGALLLMVALLLAVIAALAFSLNRAAGMDVQSVAVDYERRNAAYLAEAAVAAAKWTNEVKCGSQTPISQQFAGATLSATVKMTGSKRINVVASAVTASGTTATLTRNAVDIVNFNNTETKDLGGSVRDTYITFGVPVPVVNSSSLTLTSGQSNALLYWATTDIPGESEVLSARLILTQNGNGSSARTVNVHRVTAQWDNSATWYQSRSGIFTGSSWNSDGGDYSGPVLASASVAGAGAYAWDVTGMVDGWYSGRLVNYGMLLRLPDAGQTVTFYSLEASNSSVRPTLRVTFAKQC